jgi:SAM-dependent methyltransferase
MLSEHPSAVSASSRTWQDRYYARYYTQVPGYVEGTLEFYGLISKYCPAHGKILEIGAGPSNRTSRFLSTLGEVDGIDPDPAVLTNDALRVAKVMGANGFPVADTSYDCCVSDYVVEHVENGEEHLREVARVLKTGGHYIFRTVHRFHYVALIAAATPHKFHTLVANRARRLPPTTHDPYPTRYAMNTFRAVERAAKRAGLHVEQVMWAEKEPAYGRFSRLAFLIMLLYERFVNSSPLFSGWRANLYVVLRKTG